MRFGDSYGEACRFCGSTQIIVWPPSSSGNCAMCSDEVQAWEARLDQVAERRLALARAAFLAEEAQRRAAGRAQRWAARRAALAEGATRIARASLALPGAGARRAGALYRRELRMLAASVLRARRSLLRPLPARSDTAHNY
jgi:hypothetical protein